MSSDLCQTSLGFPLSNEMNYFPPTSIPTSPATTPPPLPPPSSIRSIRSVRSKLHRPPFSPSARLFSLAESGAILQRVVADLDFTSLSLSKSKSMLSSPPTVLRSTFMHDLIRGAKVEGGMEATTSTANDKEEEEEEEEEEDDKIAAAGSHIVVGGVKYYTYEGMMRLQQHLEQLQNKQLKKQPIDKMRVERLCCRRVYQDGEQLLSIAQETVLDQTNELLVLRNKVKELESIVVERDAHIEELHDEYEEEIRQQLESQRVLLTRRARAVKLAALREKDKHMKTHLENVTAHVTKLAEKTKKWHESPTKK